MLNSRKFWIGLAFLFVSGFLTYTGINHGTDLLGLGTVIGAISVGVGTLMWGDAQEWKHKMNATNGNGKPTP